MLAEFVQKIVDLKKTETFEINGQTYADRDLERIPPHVDRPQRIEVNSLNSICKLIKKEIEKFHVPIFCAGFQAQPGRRFYRVYAGL